MIEMNHKCEGRLETAARKTLDAAREFWEVKETLQLGGAVQWLRDDAGGLLVFTRGEYLSILMQNIEEINSSKPVITFGEQLDAIELQAEAKRLRAEERLLVKHFRNVDIHEGKRGDLDNASPAESAVRVMNERKARIKQLDVFESQPEVKRLRKDQQWLHALVGQLCCLFPNTSPLMLLENVKRLQAEVKRLEPRGLAQTREIKRG